LSPRRIIFIAIALIASLATVFLGRAWLSAGRVQQTATPAPVIQEKSATQILVAGHDLAVGKIVRAEDLRWQAWPDDGVSKNYTVEGQKNLQDFVGFAVRSALIEGEPITLARVVSPKDHGFLAAVLEPGNRAVTVALTPAAGNAGFIFPGDSVDVLATLTLIDASGNEKDTSNKEHHASETVLTNIKVLAIDQRADDQNKEVAVGKTATLEVTPKQAEILSVVSDIGKISLALRSLPTKDEDLAMASGNEGRKGVTWTFDSDATKLIRPPNSATTQQVVIYRRAEGKAVDFVRPIAAGGGQQTSGNPGDAH
jgi:pilus assembly protein CpaB